MSTMSSMGRTPQAVRRACIQFGDGPMVTSAMAATYPRRDRIRDGDRNGGKRLASFGGPLWPGGGWFDWSWRCSLSGKPYAVAISRGRHRQAVRSIGGDVESSASSSPRLDSFERKAATDIVAPISSACGERQRSRATRTARPSWPELLQKSQIVLIEEPMSSTSDFNTGTRSIPMPNAEPVTRSGVADRFETAGWTIPLPRI